MELWAEAFIDTWKGRENGKGLILSLQRATNDYSEQIFTY
jgi:hypothetical protein